MKTVSGKEISALGIGCYGIGGRGHRGVAITEKVEDRLYIEALIRCLDKGLNFTEISAGYGHGKALTLFEQAFKQSAIKREDLFLTHSFYPVDLPLVDTITEDIRHFYSNTSFGYADSTLVTQTLFAEYGDAVIYAFLHSLLDKGRTRYVSLSNAGPARIRSFRQEFGDKFIAHEGHLSFEVRELEDQGIFAVCDQLDVTNIIWRPLRRNLTSKQGWPLLNELAAKYQRTQNQVVLNWILHLGYHPMVMSASIKHIKENITAQDFQMTAEDYQKINEFRPSNYHPPLIDWNKDADGDEIVTLAKDFEKHLKKH